MWSRWARGGRVLALSAARYDDPGLRDEMTLLERSLVAEGVDEPMDARVEAEWLAEMAERAFDRFGRDSRFVQDLGPAPRLIPERGAP